MRRRKRITAPPTKLLYGREMTRLLSMIAMLVVLAMMINRAGDPALWKWLADDARGEAPADRVQVDATAAGVPLALAATDQRARDPAGVNAIEDPAPAPAASKPAAKKSAETIVPGPTDLEPEEREIALEHFQAIVDKAPIQAEDMPSYWRFMRWSRAQSFKELQKRSRRDLMFTHLWQQPEVHRGELVQLHLHVRRVLSWDAPENSAGVKRIYEAWGTTDESKSFPYVVVFSDLPPDLPLGDDLLEEAVFVGYFLKNMSYTAYDVERAAPLLVGRLEWRVNPARQALAEARKTNELGVWQGSLVAIAAVLVLGAGWYSWRSKKRPDLPSPAEEAKVNGWITQLDEPVDEQSSAASDFAAEPPRDAERRRPRRADSAWQQPDPFDFGE